MFLLKSNVLSWLNKDFIYFFKLNRSKQDEGDVGLVVMIPDYMHASINHTYFDVYAISWGHPK